MIMATAAKVKPPASFWIIVVISLIWNAIGANDYLQTQLENRAYLESATQGMNVTVDELIAHFRSYPLWADMAWGLGVWGSVAGSLLMLARSRYATHAFIASLAGLVLSTIYTLIDPMPGSDGSMVLIAFTVVIFAVLLGLVWYARKMTARRVLT